MTKHFVEFEKNYPKKQVLAEINLCHQLKKKRYLQDANKRFNSNIYEIQDSDTYYIVFKDYYLPMKAIMRMAFFENSGELKSLEKSSAFFRYIQSGAYGSGITAEHLAKPNDTKNSKIPDEKTYNLSLSRPSQAKFRKRILKLHHNKCVITGCSVIHALEAAHIIHFSDDPNNNSSANGFPMRRDIHRLFDLNFIKIDPSNFSVSVSSILKPEYENIFSKVRLNVGNKTRDQVQCNLKNRYLYLNN